MIKKKKPMDWTTNEAAKKLFPKELIQSIKQNNPKKKPKNEVNVSSK